mgnify:CR=1 FL=1
MDEAKLYWKLSDEPEDWSKGGLRSVLGRREEMVYAVLKALEVRGVKEVWTGPAASGVNQVSAERTA